MKTFQNFRSVYGVFWLTFFAAVISVCGCQPDYVPTPPVAPSASFSYTSVRTFPVTVQFTNLSTNPFPGTSAFIWDFGDGTVSTITNPVHTYPVAGTFMISLVQIYPNATRDTLIKALQLNPTGPSGVSSKQNGTAATDFAFSVPSIYLVSFTNTSTNATGYLWEFGDATSSTSAATTVTHQYIGTGPFNVKMTATGGGGSDTCSAQIIF